jgi:hypothetical protein
MRRTFVTLWLLTAVVAAACAAAVVADRPSPWLALAAAAGLLAVLAALQLLSIRLWHMSAESKDASQGAARSVVSELHSMHIILGRFPECSLPTTGYSMTFGNLHALLELLDDLQPQTVVEFGSGLSTVMVSAWMKRRGYGRIHSFDHDSVWAAKTSRHLVRHKLDGYVTLSSVPLVSTSFHGHTVQWYDINETARAIGKIDFVIVDGPPSHDQPMARLPAVFALRPHLAPDCCITLDDALRPEEREVAAIWREYLPEMESYTIPSQTGLAVFRRSTARTVFGLSGQ